MWGTCRYHCSDHLLPVCVMWGTCRYHCSDHLLPVCIMWGTQWPDLQQGPMIYVADCYRFSDDELILECRVRCHPPPKVTWLKDGVPLQGSHRHQQSELADGVCRLIISSPDSTADSGQYTCVAENNVWSDQISSAVQFAGTKEMRCRCILRYSGTVHKTYCSRPTCTVRKWKRRGLGLLDTSS
jgi:hypothetical protein